MRPTCPAASSGSPKVFPKKTNIPIAHVVRAGSKVLAVQNGGLPCVLEAPGYPLSPDPVGSGIPDEEILYGVTVCCRH
jgi:hypothetical protein